MNVCRGRAHTGPAWQVFGAAFDIIEEIYSSRSPDDKRLAVEQMQLETFYFTGSKLCFELLAAEGLVGSYTVQRRKGERRVFIWLSKRVVIFEREESKEKMRIQKVRLRGKFQKHRISSSHRYITMAASYSVFKYSV